MKEFAILILCLVAGACSAPFSNVLTDYIPTLVGLQSNFNSGKIDSSSGNIALKSGPVDVILSRDSSGALAGGMGLTQMGELNLGLFGKVSIQASTTIDGMYNALMDTQISTGSNSFNPLTLMVTRGQDGTQYTGMTDLGYVGGSAVASTADNTIPTFEVHLNTDGWVTGKAGGRIADKKLVMDSYIAGIDVGLMSGAASWDGNMALQDFEFGGSLGLIYGSIKHTKKDSDFVKSYKSGVSLGVFNIDMLTGSDDSKTYLTVVDLGVMKIKHKTSNGKQSGKGTLEMSNYGLDYEVNEDGFQIGGARFQLGTSLVEIHKDSNGEYQVTVKRGMS